MTPMVDTFFLLLTFFMLTAQFRPQESVVVDTPYSISNLTAPDKRKMTITVDANNQVFFNIDNGIDTSERIREKVLREIAAQRGLQFTEEEIAKFAALESFSLPITSLKQWINSPDRAAGDKLNTGMPMDSTDNQLSMWIRATRLVSPEISVVLRGDNTSDYKAVRKVIDALQDNNVRVFNLVTNLEVANVDISNLNL